MNVVVRMPTRGYPAFTASHAFRRASKRQPEWDFGEFMNNQGQAIARSRAVMEARDADADFLIMIDDDVTCPQDLGKLVSHNLPVVGVPIPTIKQGKILLTAWQPYSDKEVISVDWRLKGLHKVWMVGAGVICIRKDVLFRRDLDPLFYYDQWPDGGLRWAEDGWFAKLCRENDIQQWIDMDLVADHCKAVTLNQFVRATPEMAGQFIDVVEST